MMKSLIFFTIFTSAATLAPLVAQGDEDGGSEECDQETGECETPDTIADQWSDQSLYQSPDDYDDDGKPDAEDNCPEIANPDQSDVDEDGVGDICDNCPNHANTDQSDLDWDGIGDICDNDADRDGVLNTADNCPWAYNPNQEDLDGNGLGDACDPDIDGDRLDNLEDNCPYGLLDHCNRNSDNDGIEDFVLLENGALWLDNCPYVQNPDQADLDQDGLGDACDPDQDGDDVNNHNDNCPEHFNPTQNDSDRDGKGDEFNFDGTGNGLCDDQFCYVVQGDVEYCLNPQAPFAVYTPRVLRTNEKQTILLHLFANRSNATLRYKWEVRGKNGTTDSLVGATDYSTPFDYHYLSISAATYTPSSPGDYEVTITAEQVFEDSLTHEVGLVATAHADLEVSGVEHGGFSDDCACRAVGRADVPRHKIMLLSFLVLLTLTLRRQRHKKSE